MVAIEAISGRKKIPEIAADHAINPILVSQLNHQVFGATSALFTMGKKSNDKVERLAKQGELFQQISKF